jgi:esterase
MQLHYTKMGDTGPSIIVLHGLFGRGRNWYSIAKFLSSAYQVYLVDLRNHGLSPHADEMAYEDMVNDVVAFQQTHQLLSFNLIGHSMGGKVAMLLALKYPQLINHLAIIDIAPVTYQHNFADILDALLSLPLAEIKSRKQAELLLANKIPQAEIRQFLLQNLCLASDGGEKSYWRFNLPVLKASIEQIVGFPLSDNKQQNKVQSTVNTLFIAGTESDYINNSNRKVIKHFFPKANIVKVKDAGHWLHAEQPEILKNILIRFLKDSST